MNEQPIFITHPDKLALNNDYTALVLSAGAAKGIIQLGALQCLYSKNHLNNLDTFCGTSAGSIICFFLVLNYTPVEILSILCTSNFMKTFVDKRPNIFGLVSTFGMYSFDEFFSEVEKATIKKIGFVPTMKELFDLTNKHLICVTFNITKNKTEYIDYISHPNISCLEPLKMSSNIPLAFEKYVYDKCFYIDGAVTDKFPIKYTNEMLLQKNEYFRIIALGLQGNRIDHQPDETNFFKYIQMIVTIPTKISKNKAAYTSEHVDLILICDEDDENTINLRISLPKMFELFSKGYSVIKNIIKNKKQKID